jgi:acyl dehydratase
MQQAAPDAGVYAEDLRVGTTWQNGEHEVTTGAIIDFASQWDPQFFHTDPERADREGALEGLIASGIHTIAIYQRLEVICRTQHWHVIGGTGMENLRLRRPVRPGDVLSGHTTICKSELEPERGRGLVTFAGRLANQRAEVVMTLTMSAYLLMRSRPQGESMPPRPSAGEPDSKTRAAQRSPRTETSREHAVLRVHPAVGEQIVRSSRPHLR